MLNIIFLLNKINLFLEAPRHAMKHELFFIAFIAPSDGFWLAKSPCKKGSLKRKLKEEQNKKSIIEIAFNASRNV